MIGLYFVDRDNIKKMHIAKMIKKWSGMIISYEIFWPQPNNKSEYMIKLVPVMQTYVTSQKWIQSQKKNLAAKTGFGNILPKPILSAKSFGLSMFSTNSASSDCQNHFWLPIFFGSQKWFWQSAANSKILVDTMFLN